MSNFICQQCGKTIVDTERGYITGCEHYRVSLGRDGDRMEIMIGKPENDDSFGINSQANLNEVFDRLIEAVKNGQI